MTERRAHERNQPAEESPAPQAEQQPRRAPAETDEQPANAPTTVPESQQASASRWEASHVQAYTREELIEAYGPQMAGALNDLDPGRTRLVFNLIEAERALEEHGNREVLN